MSTKVRIKWNGKMAFDADVNGFVVRMDAAPEAGGKDQGPRPKPLTLAALGGCTGMDVVSILEKMRVPLDSFDMKIEAEQTDEHPRVYKRIHIVYTFKGKDLPLEKIQKAVDLSQEKYCGVSSMLRRTAALTYEIEVLSE
jgi:putative redox protein